MSWNVRASQTRSHSLTPSAHAFKITRQSKAHHHAYTNFDTDNWFATGKQYLPEEYVNPVEKLIYAAMFASVGSALAQLNSVCATLVFDLFH